jgi:hypothetical protein
VQIRQASKLPRHPLNFVLLNRVALDRPDLFPTPHLIAPSPKHGYDNYASTRGTRCLSAKGKQNVEKCHKSRPVSAPVLHTPILTPATQCAHSANPCHLNAAETQIQGTLDLSAQSANDAGDHRLEDGAEETEDGGVRREDEVEARVASVIAALFSASSQEAEVKRRHVLARLRARPGSGGSPCKLCDSSHMLANLRWTS